MCPGLDVYYADLAQHVGRPGSTVDDLLLDRDLSNARSIRVFSIYHILLGWNQYEC